MTETSKPNAGEKGSAVLIVLMLLVALAGIQSAVTQYGRSLEKQLGVLEEQHNRQFRHRYPSKAAN